MQRTPELVERAILQAHQAGTSTQEIAKQFGVHTRTVYNLVARNGDLAAATQSLDSQYLEGGFRYVWLDALDRLRHANELSSQDHKNYSLSMAICLDKIAMLRGFPTQVIAHLHEHRGDIGSIAAKLSDVAHRLHGDTLAQRQAGTLASNMPRQGDT
jgi:IS30 family transposase